MLNLRRSAFALAISSSLFLIACGDDAADTSSKVASAAPTAQVSKAAVSAEAMNAVETTKEMNRLFKTNDFHGIMKMMMTKDQYAEVVKQWDEKRKEPITEQQSKEFADSLAQLTAPGAIDNLMAMAEPQLAQMKPQMAMYIPGGVMMLNSAIDENADMTPEQKAQSKQMITALQGWAMKTDLTDPARLRKMLTELANGAKATKITQLDQLRALPLPEMMGKVGMMAGAFKRGLTAYDMNVDQMIDSLKVEQVSGDANTAKLRTTMNFLGTEIVTDSEMVRSDGRWMAKGTEGALKQITDGMTGKLGG
jgi:hypothetical protein